jgi:hypothetical protein
MAPEEVLIMTESTVSGIMNLASYARHAALSLVTSPGTSQNTSDTHPDSLDLDLQRRNLERMKERVKNLQESMNLTEKELSDHLHEVNNSKDCVKEYEHRLKIEKVKEKAIMGSLTISGLAGIAAGVTAYAASSVITSPVFLGASLALTVCVGAAALIIRYLNNAPDTIERCEREIEYHTQNIQYNRSAAQVVEWHMPSLQNSLQNAKKEQAAQEIEILKNGLHREKSGNVSVSDDDEFIMIDEVKLKKNPRNN